jgi:hypothetical protein
VQLLVPILCHMKTIFCESEQLVLGITGSPWIDE